MTLAHEKFSVTLVYDRERQFGLPISSLSVIQHYNAAAIRGTFAHTTPENDLSRSSILSLVFCFNPLAIFTTEGKN